MNLATRITVVRILAAPLVLVLLLKGWVAAAFWIYAAAALTDSVDGWVARRFGQETRLGALLDPVGDKLMMVCVFPGLVLRGWMEPWVLASLITRDALVALGWGLTYVLLGDTEPHTRFLGKAATMAQMLLGAATLFAAAYPQTAAPVAPALALLTPAAVALTALSMLDYLVVGSRRFN